MPYNYSLHYRKWHSEDEDHIRKMTQNRWDFLKKYVPSDKKSTILDIGCGFGFALIALKENGYENLLGVDNSVEQLGVARKLGIETLETKDTLAWLDENKEKYDFILLIDVLEHIPKEQQIEVLDAIYGSLKPSGELLCVVPNANSPIAMRWENIDFTHHASYTEYSLSFLLECADFEHITFHPETELGFSYRFWSRTARSSIKRAFFRRIWRMVLESEQPYEDFKSLSLDRNLVITGRKSAQKKG